MPLEEAQQMQDTGTQEVLEEILKGERNKILYLAMNRLEQRKRDSAHAVFWRTITERDCGDFENDTGKCEGIIVSGKA